MSASEHIWGAGVLVDNPSDQSLRYSEYLGVPITTPLETKNAKFSQINIPVYPLPKTKALDLQTYPGFLEGESPMTRTDQEKRLFPFMFSNFNTRQDLFDPQGTNFYAPLGTNPFSLEVTLNKARAPIPYILDPKEQSDLLWQRGNHSINNRMAQNPLSLDYALKHTDKKLTKTLQEDEAYEEKHRAFLEELRKDPDLEESYDQLHPEHNPWLEKKHLFSDRGNLRTTLPTAQQRSEYPGVILRDADSEQVISNKVKDFIRTHHGDDIHEDAAASAPPLPEAMGYVTDMLHVMGVAVPDDVPTAAPIIGPYDNVDFGFLGALFDQSDASYTGSATVPSYANNVPENEVGSDEDEDENDGSFSGLLNDYRKRFLKPRDGASKEEVSENRHPDASAPPLDHDFHLAESLLNTIHPVDGMTHNEIMGTLHTTHRASAMTDPHQRREMIRSITHQMSDESKRHYIGLAVNHKDALNAPHETHHKTVKEMPSRVVNLAKMLVAMAAGGAVMTEGFYRGGKYGLKLYRAMQSVGGVEGVQNIVLGKKSLASALAESMISYNMYAGKTISDISFGLVAEKLGLTHEQKVASYAAYKHVVDYVGPSDAAKVMGYVAGVGLPALQNVMGVAASALAVQGAGKLLGPNLMAALNSQLSIGDGGAMGQQMISIMKTGLPAAAWFGPSAVGAAGLMQLGIQQAGNIANLIMQEPLQPFVGSVALALVLGSLAEYAVKNLFPSHVGDKKEKEEEDKKFVAQLNIGRPNMAQDEILIPSAVQRQISDSYLSLGKPGFIMVPSDGEMVGANTPALGLVAPNDTPNSGAPLPNTISAAYGLVGSEKTVHLKRNNRGINPNQATQVKRARKVPVDPSLLGFNVFA